MKKIPLTQGQFALVDDEDYEWLSQYKWYVSFAPTYGQGGGFRATRKERQANGKQKAVYMHRMILGDPRDENGKAAGVDHINHDTLDNRRKNLRIDYGKRNAQNTRKPKNNTSGYKGVSWYKPLKKWRAAIRYNGKQTHLGLFNCKHQAAIVYNQAALKYHGEYACLNSIPELDLHHSGE